MKRYGKTFIKGSFLLCALLIFCISNIPVHAYTNEEKTMRQSCVQCGNTSFYNATEGTWVILEKVPCVHGTGRSDITEVRDLFDVTRCQYCHYLIEQTYLKTETHTYCSNT